MPAGIGYGRSVLGGLFGPHKSGFSPYGVAGSSNGKGKTSVLPPRIAPTPRPGVGSERANPVNINRAAMGQMRPATPAVHRTFAPAGPPPSMLPTLGGPTAPFVKRQPQTQAPPRPVAPTGFGGGSLYQGMSPGRMVDVGAPHAAVLDAVRRRRATPAPSGFGGLFGSGPLAGASAGTLASAPPGLLSIFRRLMGVR